VNEKLFQDQVLQIARMNGWKWSHHSAHQVRGRWMSDSPGTPDLMLMHPLRGFILAELKSETGQATPAQVEWIVGALGHTVETYLWRPADLNRIATRLGATHR